MATAADARVSHLFLGHSDGTDCGSRENRPWQADMVNGPASLGEYVPKEERVLIDGHKDRIGMTGHITRRPNTGVGRLQILGDEHLAAVPGLHPTVSRPSPWVTASTQETSTCSARNSCALPGTFVATRTSSRPRSTAG